MSDDGRLLYIHAGVDPPWKRMVYIYDTKSQSFIFSLDVGKSFDSHSISGNGKRIAYGGDNFVAWYYWSGVTYEFQDLYMMDDPVHCVRCDLSADGSTLAAAFWGYENYLDFRVVSINVITGVVNFEADFTGSGILQNYPYKIVTNDDGSLIVYGGWGDQLNTNPEVMVFQGDPNPVAWIDTRGSAYDVDISGDGVFIASGSKYTHANQWGNGGHHSCFYMGGQDLYIEGAPTLSTNSITLNVKGDPGERVKIAASSNEVDIQTIAGDLIIDPENYICLGGGIIPKLGALEIDVNIPSNPELLGQKVVTQAILNDDKNPHLTNGQAFWILP